MNTVTVFIHSRLAPPPYVTHTHMISLTHHQLYSAVMLDNTQSDQGRCHGWITVCTVGIVLAVVIGVIVGIAMGVLLLALLHVIRRRLLASHVILFSICR